ncbi:MAG: hypothetical protein DHS20C11_24400 [Lysobacteraceae bacterium]|nr:MAG: hypothetical protein DHS20C11_24400 [Xanthomonadaceae bacterium]
MGAIALFQTQIESGNHRDQGGQGGSDAAFKTLEVITSLNAMFENAVKPPRQRERRGGQLGRFFE